METENQGVEVLRKAKELIITRGWGKGKEILASSSSEAPFCLLTAVSYVIEQEYKNTPEKITVYDEAYSRLVKIIGVESKFDLITWNDKEKTKFEDVMKVFDQAIAL